MYIFFLSAVFHKYLLNEITTVQKKKWGQYIDFNVMNIFIWQGCMKLIKKKVRVKAFIILNINAVF